MKFRFLFSLTFMLVVFVEIGAAESSQLERFKDFETQLNNVTLTGFFTVVGKDKPPTEESYTILSVSKLGKGDLWVFNTLMKKNGQEVQLPIPLPVKWVEINPLSIWIISTSLPWAPFVPMYSLTMINMLELGPMVRQKVIFTELLKHAVIK